MDNTNTFIGAFFVSLELYSLKNSPFVFYRILLVKEIWSNMRVSKWRQILFFIIYEVSYVLCLLSELNGTELIIGLVFKYFKTLLGLKLLVV